MHQYGVDAAYQISDKWQANAWYTFNDLKQDQAFRFDATATSTTLWLANLENESDSFGVGVQGKPMARVDVGADLLYSTMTDKFGTFTLSGPAAVSNIPDIRTRITRLNLFTQYAIDKNTGVRLTYVFDRWQSNEWTWSQFVYTDGTRLVQDPSQKVHFIGLSGYYRFR
jgi:hypothetical protein